MYTVQVLYCTEGWSVEIFLIGQNMSSNERSGMILEVQIKICLKLSLKKNSRGLKY